MIFFFFGNCFMGKSTKNLYIYLQIPIFGEERRDGAKLQLALGRRVPMLNFKNAEGDRHVETRRFVYVIRFYIFTRFVNSRHTFFVPADVKMTENYNTRVFSTFDRPFQILQPRHVHNIITF